MKKEKNHIFPVILAGGVGTRFWPLSRRKKPKQFLTVFAKKSLLRLTAERVRQIVQDRNLLVVCEKSLAPLVRRELPFLPAANLLAEPEGKNTAPAIGLAALEVLRRDPEGILLVLPSDHFIGNEVEFVRTSQRAVDAVARLHTLVTFGIAPSRPETGYGYIQVEKPVNGEPGLFQVARFVEKPDRKRAEQFLKSGKFLWNSGMFCMPAAWVISRMKVHLPDLFQAMEKLKRSRTSSRYRNILEEVYGKIRPISIDYGLIEKAKNILTLRADMGWNDVGSWTVFDDLLKPDKKGNRSWGPVAALESTGVTALSRTKLIGLIGVKDLFVVETDDAILICRKGDVQKTKNLVDLLNSDFFKKYT